MSVKPFEISNNISKPENARDKQFQVLAKASYNNLDRIQDFFDKTIKGITDYLFCQSTKSRS
jgi:hypothetical protein